MTIRAYCDAAYAIILEEKQRLGTSLDEAVEQLQDWAVGIFLTEEERAAERLARQNEAELRKFEAMMAGLGA